MGDIESLEQEFVYIFERIIQDRGYSPIIGRIYATFFLKAKEMTQEELAELTGYSISSISRALNQLTKLGTVTKRREPSLGERGKTVYRIAFNLLDLTAGGITALLYKTKEMREEFERLYHDISSLSSNDETTARRKLVLERLIRDWIYGLTRLTKVMNQALNELTN